MLILSVVAAARLRFHADPSSFEHFIAGIAVWGLLVAVCITGAMVAFGLYQAYVRHSRLELLRIARSFALGGIALLVLYYIAPAAYIGRGVLAVSLLIGMGAVLGVRYVVSQLSAAGMLKQRVLVYGAGNNANLINTRLCRKSDRQSFNMIGFLPASDQPVVVDEAMLIRTGETLCPVAGRLNVDEIVIAPDERRGGMPVEQMLNCVQQGVLVTDLPTFFEREAGVVQLNIVDPSWLVFSGGFDYSTPRRLTKRFFDLLAGTARRVPTIEPLAEYLVRSGSLPADKRKAVRGQWNIYRNVEGLDPIRAAWCFALCGDRGLEATAVERSSDRRNIAARSPAA